MRQKWQLWSPQYGLRWPWEIPQDSGPTSLTGDHGSQQGSGRQHTMLAHCGCLGDGWWFILPHRAWRLRRNQIQFALVGFLSFFSFIFRALKRLWNPQVIPKSSMKSERSDAVQYPGSPCTAEARLWLSSNLHKQTTTSKILNSFEGNLSSFLNSAQRNSALIVCSLNGFISAHPFENH